MDNFIHFLHISNIMTETFATLPGYSLYGETEDSRFPDILHCETIYERSSFHDWHIKPHRHTDVVQFFHLTKGFGEITLEGESLALFAPCVIHLPTLIVHGFRFEPETEGLVLTLPARLVEQGLRHRPLLLKRLTHPQVIPLSPEHNDEIAPLFQAIAAEFAGHEEGRIDALAAQAVLLTLWFARHAPVRDEDKTPAPAQSVVLARSFQTLIEKNLRQQWPLTRYASELGISTTHLSRICHQVLGRNALAVLHDRIIFEIQRELAYTSLSITQISERLGFVDPAYFTRFYHKMTGEPPSAFRQKRLR